ncbi:Cytochrome P450 monooxygenase ATR2 [Metarhizium brunneum]|uniref:Cytochrome P450 monooxygenase ATR2 n=1 Tax=Metarhizium brunneum TaxID=500148 RepID=A0A7D5YQ61_9HYPO|nr:Cytochrome P450 monooxygenase ATR2 [Metarhizium brunneum]
MSMELAGVSGPAPVKINKLLLRITAMASGRAFVGPKLWLKEEYIDNAINFTTDFMMAVASVAFLPVWLRPILSPIMPLVRALHRRIQSEKKLMYPVVLSRRELGATVGSSMKPDDLLEWLIDNTAGAGDEDDMSIIHKQMVTSFAAVHTSSQTMTNMFYTLAAEPHVAAMLLEEVREVLGKHEGKFTLQSLQELKKMDSFAEETWMSRAPTNTSNDMIIASVQRKVLKPFALSNGQVVPAGVIIECANKAICDDPAIYDKPEVFDALRFYKTRKTKDTMSENKKSIFMLGASESQFVSTGPLSLWWGYGKHACPGRFFASSMIKMVTAKTLMQYELGLPDGVTKRCENIVYGDIIMPDVEKTIVLRKRSDGGF